MKSKTVFKILLDLTMTVLYALLMFAPGLGAFFHEVAGIGIGVLFAVHVLLNRRQLRGLSRAADGGGRGALLGLALDDTLIVGMPIVIVTGALISQILFDAGITGLWDNLFLLHDVMAWVCLAALSLHLAAHARYLVKVSAAAARQIRTPAVRKTLGRFAAGAMAAGVLYMLAFSVYRGGLAGQEYLPIVTNSTLVSQVCETPEAGDETPEASGTPYAEPQEAGADTGTQETTPEATQAPAAEESDEDKSGQTGTQTVDAAPAVTLQEFLSKLYCTGCHNHCPLSNPRCGRSAGQIEEATQDYNAAYGDQ